MGVNFLPAEACDLARLFGKETADDRFTGVPFASRTGGAPQLGAACVFVDCVLEQAHDAGDHRILVARGVAIDHASPAVPLLYHKGVFPNPIDPAAWE